MSSDRSQLNFLHLSWSWDYFHVTDSNFIDEEAAEDNTLESDSEENGDEESEQEGDDDDEEDCEGNEEENVEKEVGDSKDHKQSLKKLKNMDPEFYKYLEENDR